MTKKDFTLIAEVIKGLPDILVSRATKETVARDFAVRLFKENPRFDGARFVAACGLSGNVPELGENSDA